MAKDLTIKVNGLVDVHSERRMAPVIPQSEEPNKGDIVTYVRKNKVKKVGNSGIDELDYIVEEVVVEESRVNRQAFIEKDANDVGVLNILEKVRRSGDMTILNQTGALISEELQDYTKAPGSIQEAINIVQSGAASFEGLKAIFGNMSFEDMSKLSASDIQLAVAAYQQAQIKTEGEDK